MAAAYDLDSSDISSLFKINYDKPSEATFNSYNATISKVRIRNDFTGTSKQFPVPLSHGGSVGSGTLPTANAAIYSTATITRKKVYGRYTIDRETIYASKDDKGAFVRVTKEGVENVVKSYMRNMSRIMYGNSDGSLGTFSGNAGGSAGTPTITIISTDWKKANWEEQDYVNVNSLTSVWEITAVNPTTRVVTLNRISGTDDLTGIGAGTHTVYMQNSKNNDPEGLKGVTDATGSTKYGISVGRRWQSYQKDLTGSPSITPDLLNEAMLTIEENSGKVPNLIAMSYVQYRKYLSQLEDFKRYVTDVKPRSEALKGKVSFPGLQYISSNGVVDIVPERFVEDDRVYFLNTDEIVIHRAPNFGWFDDDGTVLLRVTDQDEYEARYGGYLQIYINPAFQGRIKGLST